MKKLECWFRNHKRIAAAYIFLFFLILTCSSFPVYNLTKRYHDTLTFTNVFISLSIYTYLGAFLSQIFPKAWFGKIFLILLGMVLGGMFCRFLLEFGEVSNTYNFTPANIALHLAVTLTVSNLSWWWTRRHPR